MKYFKIKDIKDINYTTKEMTEMTEMTDKENNVIVKILSGDIISLKVNDSSCLDSIVKELNKINPIQFPLIRTQLIKDNLDYENKIYYAYINTDLYISLMHRSIAYTSSNGFVIDNISLNKQNFKEGMDGELIDEWRGFTAIKVRFDFSSSTIYRLFVVSKINFLDGGVIISYKYDTDSKEEYEKIAGLLKNKEIKLDEEHIKNVILKLINKNNENNENNDIYKLYKDSVFYRDDTIIVLNCNGEIVYTDHYHWYHYQQQPNWDYYNLDL